jgi:hypothetical protein
VSYNEKIKHTDFITSCIAVPDCQSFATMPILYSVIARGTVVLTKYASCAGNFSEVTEQIMAKIPPENAKLTYSHGSYLFHYICENRIVYMCITDDVSINNVAAIL